MFQRVLNAVHNQAGQAPHRRLAAVAIALLALITFGSTASAAASAPAPTPTSGVRIVHGLRGIVADVYLDDAVVLQTFQPDRSTDELSMPPGDHRIDVRLSGTPATSPPMLTKTFTLADAEHLSIVLHLATNGQPTLSAFDDDVSPVGAGQTRVVVRHTASAPPIDVQINDSPIAADLANPGEVANQVAAGTYQISVEQTGTSQALAPVQAAAFAEGTATDMYFVGDQTAGTLGWIAVQIGGLQSPPVLIQTGDSGLAATNPPTDHTGRTAAELGLGAIALATILVWRRRKLSGA